MKTQKSNNYEDQLKEIIKEIVKEENYFKEKDTKVLMKDILEEIDPIIAKHVKKHLQEICYFLLERFNIPNIKSSEERDAKNS